MSSLIEINSFVGKFLHLWNTGRNASLNIESQAGDTAVTLRLDLCKPVHQPHHSHGLTNARDRRRQRRAERIKSGAEEAQSETSESQEVAEEVTCKHRTIGTDKTAMLKKLSQLRSQRLTQHLLQLKYVLLKKQILKWKYQAHHKQK